MQIDSPGSLHMQSQTHFRSSPFHSYIHTVSSPFSNCSTCFLNISALKALNAFSILALVSGSLVIVLFAALAPDSTPISPPRKSPAIEKKV